MVCAVHRGSIDREETLRLLGGFTGTAGEEKECEQGGEDKSSPRVDSDWFVHWSTCLGLRPASSRKRRGQYGKTRVLFSSEDIGEPIRL
jgi:hypothetical protein